MTKAEFEKRLTDLLTASGVPHAETVRSVEFYSEMIADRIEDGMEEAAAVAAMGDLQQIVRTILAEQSWPTVLKSKMQNASKKRRSGVWRVLLWVASPLWISLLITFAVLLLCLYVIEIALIVAWVAVILSFGLGGVGCLVCSGFFFLQNGATGLALVGVGALLLGLFLLLLLPIRTTVKAFVFLHRTMWRGIKGAVVGKKEGTV